MPDGSAGGHLAERQVVFYISTESELVVIVLILTQESVELFRLFASLRRWVFLAKFQLSQNQLNTFFYGQIIYKS